MARTNDFNLRALYEGMDAQRKARGLSWAQATREMNRGTRRSSAHRLSSSTVMGTRKRTVAEGDGVLQMLLWLGRTPESFVQGLAESQDESAWLPAIPAHRVLRFDTKKIHSTLDTQRIERRMTWAEVAKEIGLGVSSLTHLANGGRTAFPQMMRIVRWLGRPAAQFTRASEL